VNEQSAKARTAILNALKGLNVAAEYVTNTGSQSFGQVILYRKDRYAMKGKSDFKSNIESQQSNRAHKVFFNELAGNKRQFAVVNVHLAFNSPNISALLDELVTYAQGKGSPRPLAVIVGDFNYTVGKYQTKNNPKITVKQVGESVIWSGSAPSTKQTSSNVDGFIIVQP
jgi:endonuclease/exonuclease/phosphatase family metal-dependent hydrolase